jgi:hypothetical protein
MAVGKVAVLRAEAERLKQANTILAEQVIAALRERDEADGLAWRVPPSDEIETGETWRDYAATLDARIGELKAVLKATEWVRKPGWGDACPLCEVWKEDGHAPDCQLAAALKEPPHD